MLCLYTIPYSTAIGEKHAQWHRVHLHQKHLHYYKTHMRHELLYAYVDAQRRIRTIHQSQQAHLI